MKMLFSSQFTVCNSSDLIRLQTAQIKHTQNSRYMEYGDKM